MTRNLNRRTFMQRTAAGAAGASLAMAGAPVLRHVAAQSATPGAITLPDTGIELPTDDITFRWIDSGDLKALFYTEFHKAYHEAHPNITIQYDPLPWTEINRIVPLGIQSGDAHDIFAMPEDIPSSQAVAEGWAAPLDDLIPNFEEWKAKFPLGSFMDGVHVFDGKTYTFPQTSSKRYWTMTFYNTQLLEQAGYDLESERMTWDQYRETAKKITEQGQGQYYGIIFGGKSKDRLATFIRNLGRMAGAPAGGGAGFEDIDWRTGEFQYTSDQYLAAIDLLLGLNSDGSVFPGSMSLSEAEARAQFPQGIAGMLLEGPWCIPQWQRDAPDFSFGLASQPVPNDGSSTPLTYEETGSNQLWIYADSKYKNVAGDMFSYIGSVEGQVAIMAATGGNLRAMVPEAVEIAQKTVKLDPYASEALALYDEQMRLGPMVTVRNPDVAQVALERRPLTPDFGALMQGIIAGQVSDVNAAMEDLKSRSNAELERAIKAAQDKGAQVSRDDFVFADWDPTEEFTEDKYA
ncbi:MAG TPA: extracellular solute-binding protein [Thermomicrobiales bacterium]|nr:extracellular solute-binding protein [Thermomicrobiales bacterium]